MDRVITRIRINWIPLLFAFAKLILHLATAANYGLHRDAYLYLAQSGHPAPGYFSTPPLLAIITRAHTFFWGDSLLAVRLLPALAGAVSIFVVGSLIRQLKGGPGAQILGLTAYFLSPGFLRPAALLQPVIFNHLFWLLAALVVFRLVRKQDPKQLLWMIPVLGLGWMAKYSIVFYGSALLLGLLITPDRKLLWSKYLPVTIAGGLLVILPNLFWQYQHNWPVIGHMTELQETQLGNVLLKDFLISQILIHLPALPVWLGGLIWLFTRRDQHHFRVFAWAFLITLLMIVLLKGKAYYTIASYTMLVVFGAVAWEQWSRRINIALSRVVFGITLITGILILPFSIPLFKPDLMLEYDRILIERGLVVMLKWEDGEVHDLPQDYADMVGWDELGQKVWAFYDNLPDSVRSHTMIYGENYGMAGAVRYHRPDSSYPEVYSFNDAFMEWIPRYPGMVHMIYMGNSDRLPLYFSELSLVGKVEHPHFRERGLPIYFGSYPTRKLFEDWEETWQESKGRFTRKSLSDHQD